MAYNLRKRKKINMAEESETDDDDDGKIVIYLSIEHVPDSRALELISKV